MAQRLGLDHRPVRFGGVEDRGVGSRGEPVPADALPAGYGAIRSSFGK